MIQSIETTGNTIELAVDAALGELGLTRDDITYEVIKIGRASCRERVCQLV